MIKLFSFFAFLLLLICCSPKNDSKDLLIGELKLLDRGEQDDKMIAVSSQF